MFLHNCETEKDSGEDVRKARAAHFVVSGTREGGRERERENENTEERSGDPTYSLRAGSLWPSFSSQAHISEYLPVVCS